MPKGIKGFQKGHKVNVGKPTWSKGIKLHYPVWNKGKKGVQIGSNRGRHWSSEIKKKMSDAKVGKKMPEGFVPWNKGLKGWNCGDKNPAWKGGITDRVAVHEKVAGRKRPNECELCGGGGRICFDHDHKTGKFRGWICHRCNVVLGLAKDNSELLLKLVEYLRQ